MQLVPVSIFGVPPCEVKVFIIIVLLAGHLGMVDTNSNYEILEFYAGAARLAKIASSFGVETAAMDIIYDVEGDNRTKNNSMDMNTCAGFLPLISIERLVFFPPLPPTSRCGSDCGQPS